MDEKKTGARASASLWMLPCLLSAAWLAACGGAEPLEESSPLLQQEQDLVTLPIRINVGGGAFTDTYGRLWQADTGHVCCGQVFQTTEPIAGTENDGLYQSLRIGDSDIRYEIPVPGPGIYTVQFLLIEPQSNLSSPRNMRIDAEGQTFVDQYQALTSPLRSYTLFFDVPVTDGSLSLYLRPNPGSLPPVVSAIEVTQSKWSWLGGGPLAAGTVVTGRPAMALDGNNRPVVAWEDRSSQSPSAIISVARWTGSAYQRLGGPLSTDRSSRPAVLVDASGAPVVSFIQTLPSPTGVCARARRWSGTDWADLGGLVCLQDYEASWVASTLDSQGQPVMAVVFNGYYVADARVQVYRFNGLAWEQVGDAVAALGSAGRDADVDRPSIAVDPTDRIVVAWSESYWRGDLSGKSFTHVFRRTNGQWVRVGTQVPSSTATASRHPSLAIAPNGAPWVAYLKGGAVDVVREQNGVWASTSSTGPKGWSGPVEKVGAPLLRIDSAGTPSVLLLERAVTLATGRFLRKWNGTAWAPADNRVGPLDTTFLGSDTLFSSDTDMAFALNSSGLPVVAIPETPPSGATYGSLRLRTSTP